MKKERNNKGFSLVELIVVIAIMAVLVGVLAPQYLRYVEKSRLQKDNSAIAEIANAIKIAMADETINNETATGTTVATAATAGNKVFTFAADGTALQKELNATLGASVTTSSNAYKDSTTAITLIITKDNATGSITVSATGWIDSVGSKPYGVEGASAASKTF